MRTFEKAVLNHSITHNLCGRKWSQFIAQRYYTIYDINLSLEFSRSVVARTHFRQNDYVSSTLHVLQQNYLNI